MERSSSQGVLGSLAGYAMSDSDGEEMDKLSGNISGSDDEHSAHSQAPSRTYSPVIKDDEHSEKKRVPMSSLGLVSYGGHDDDDDSDRDVSKNIIDEELEEVSPAKPEPQEDIEDVKDETVNETEDQLQASLNGVEEVDDSDVIIPPSPPGSPPQSLIDKISMICRRGVGSLDAAIQNRKDFRNPSIYEKLLSHVGVDEKGTNYPPELYDPSIWSKSSYYDELAKLQNIEMEKRKNEKKDRVKVDFITATKTSSGTADSADNPGGKKSKWDSGGPQGSHSQSASSIPPVGSLIRKK